MIKRIFVSTLLLVFNVLTTVYGQTDTDNDGMSDEFENLYELDANDPKDAFGDMDGDNVLNLQEFILGTDPLDKNIPDVYEYNPIDPISNLYDMMRSAGNEIVVIRMSQGEYDFIYGGFTGGSDYRMMIQGGWNDDFSEYNPCRYRTILKRDGDDLGTINIIDFNSSDMRIVIDGIDFNDEESAALDLDLSSALQINSVNGPLYMHVHNSRFLGNYDTGLFASTALFGSDPQLLDLTVSNSLFVNHTDEGITIASDLIDTLNARIINCTIENPNAEFGGIVFRVEPVGNVKIVNSILWNNGLGGAFNNLSFEPGLIINTESSSFESQTDSYVLNETNTFGIAPEYTDPFNGDYSLLDNNPLIDSGVFTGLSSLDIGYSESNCFMTSVEKIQEEMSYKSYPNPTIEKYTIELDATLDYDIQVLDSKGQILNIKSTHNVDRVQLDFSPYVKGIYFVQIRLLSEHLTRQIKVIKL